MFPHFHATETQNDVWCAPCPDSSQLFARIIHILDEHHPEGLLEYATSIDVNNAPDGFYLPAAFVELINPQSVAVIGSTTADQGLSQSTQYTTALRGPPAVA